MADSPTQNSALSSLNISAPPSAGATTKGKFGSGNPSVEGNLPGYTPPQTFTGTQFYGFGNDANASFAEKLASTDTVGAPYNELSYTKSDIMAPAADLAGIPTVQAELVAMGYLNPTAVQRGVWNTASQSAYAKVLSFANQNAMNVQDAMTYLVANPTIGSLSQSGGAGGRGGGAGGVGSAVGLTSQADLQNTFQNEAQQLTGQQQAAPQQFVDQYHGQEAAAQHPRGATYTAPPTAANAADQYLQQQDPSQVQAYGVASRMQDFYSLIGGIK